MKAFRLVSDGRLSAKGYIKGEHVWCLPGATCPKCKTTWGAAGLEYPATTIHGKSANAFKSGVVDWKTYQRLKEAVETNLPLILPGTHFGPIIGSFQGGPVELDFNWLRPWTLLVRSKARIELATVLREQHLVEPQIKGSRESLIEIQIEPRCQLHPQSFVADSGKTCETCGRNPQRLVQPILEQDSIPKGIHMFRPRNFLTIIIVSQEFVEACNGARLTNAEFEEIPIA